MYNNLSSYMLALLGNAINQRMNLRSPDDPVVGANADATFNLLKTIGRFILSYAEDLKRGKGVPILMHHFCINFDL